MANKQNAVIVRASIRVGWLFAALALLPLSVSAKGYSPAVAGSTVAWTNATIGKAQLSSAAAGVAVTAPVSFSVAAGALVPAVVTGVISGASAAGGWGAAIGGIGALAIYAIPTIKGWMDRAGVTVSPDGSFGKPDPNSCTSSPCYTFSGYGKTGQKLAAFCSAADSGKPSSGAYAMAVNTPSGKSSCTRTMTWYNCTGPDCVNSSDTYDVSQFIDGTYEPGAGSSTPSTFAQAQVSMASTTPSAAEVQALVDANFPPVVEPKSITGPASIAGPNTVKLGLDGSSQTETCKFFVEYFPSNITAHPECTTVTTIPEKIESKTVTTTNPDGTTSTSVISTKTPATSKTETTTKDAVENKEKSECEQYPNRVGCAELDVPTGEIPKITKSVSYREETLFGSGSCPADLSANIGTLHQTVKIWDWQKTCEMALPLRALVLSLATFAALLIIMPGGAKS